MKKDIQRLGLAIVIGSLAIVTGCEQRKGSTDGRQSEWGAPKPKMHSDDDNYYKGNRRNNNNGDSYYNGNGHYNNGGCQ